MKTLSPNTPITAQLFSTKHVRQPTRTLHGRTTHCAHHTRYRNAVSLEISRCSTSTALQKSQRLVKRSRFHTFTVTFEIPLVQTKRYVYSWLVALNERRTPRSQYRVSVQCDEVFGGSCYIVEEDRLTWADARDRCVQLGGHLAIIESEAEDQFVFELAEGKQQQGPMIGRVKVYIYMQWLQRVLYAHCNTFGGIHKQV